MEGKCPQCGAPLDGERCGYCGYCINQAAKERPIEAERSDSDARAKAPARRRARQPEPEIKPIFHDEALEKTPQRRILYGISQRKWSTTLLLCIFLGFLGAHRFYTKKMWTGLLYLFTFGLCGIGWLVDILLILTNIFRDGYDLTLRR